jgi:hypothetical protein
MALMLRSSSIQLSVVLGLAMMSPGLSACSSDDAPAANPHDKVGDIRQNQTWKTGDKLVGVVSIFEGATVDIEPGAKIGCTPAAKIQVGGTLRVKAGANRAKITCPQWSGILVATNGRVELDGVDLENPEVGIETTKGAAETTVSESSITASVRPFLVGEGTKLTATSVKVTTPTTLGSYDVSVSQVFGTLVAKKLDYDAGGNEGMMAMRGGSIEIEDSTLKAKNGADLVSSYGGKLLKVSYTTLTGAHCGPHVDASKDADKVPTESFEFDHISSENLFGITIYAVKPGGSYLVKDSNLKGLVSWLDLKSDPAVPLSFVNVFTEGNQDSPNGPPAELKLATARIEAAKPR